MSKGKKHEIKDYVENTIKLKNGAFYNKEYGCYMKEGQNPEKALRKAQHHKSYKYGETLTASMGRK